MTRLCLAFFKIQLAWPMFWITPKIWNSNLAGSQKIELPPDLWNLPKQSLKHIPLVEPVAALNPVHFD